MKKINTVIFDLGGVLIDWNPRYVYRTIFKTEEEINWFFENITTHDWNENQDAGYPIAKATEELVAKHPDWEKEIRAYYGRWEEMLGGPVQETVDIFKLLKQKDLKEFSWEILPYGQHKLYSLLINNYQKHKSKISKLPIKTINIILNKIFGKNV